jgi:hypothetical protein
MARRSAEDYVTDLLAAMEAIDPVDIDYQYDAWSDTLYLSVLTPPQPGVSIVLHDGWMIRVHRDTDQVIGLQIENFESHTVQEHPEFANILKSPLVTVNSHDPAFERDAIEAINHVRKYVPRIAAVGD